MKERVRNVIFIDETPSQYYAKSFSYYNYLSSIKSTDNRKKIGWVHTRITIVMFIYRNTICEFTVNTVKNCSPKNNSKNAKNKCFVSHYPTLSECVSVFDGKKSID